MQKTKIFSIRLTPEESQMISEYSKQNRGDISRYVRKQLLGYLNKRNAVKTLKNASEGQNIEDTLT